MIETLKKDGGWFVDENGCFWDSRAGWLQRDVLGLCGCGNPDEIMGYVADMLERCVRRDDGTWPLGKYEDHPYMFFVYWANDKGFAEHGDTARCSWLTEKGKELLADIRTLQKEKQDGRRR